MTEYFNIGKMVAVHGLKGELILLHELGKKTSLKGLTTIFLEDKKNSMLPWFIESTSIRSEKEILIKSARIATKRAIRRSKKLNLKIKSIKNGELLEISPDGTYRIIRKIERVKSKISGIRRGSVICLR